MQLNKAVFINLDGTLVKTKSGNDHFINTDDWEFNSGILPVLKRYTNEGYYICIVSNQGGISTGKVLESDVEERIRKIDKELEQYLGCGVNSAYAKQLESYYRKPNPGMAYHFALELHLSLRDSIMIGSTKTDNDFAKNAYIGTYYHVNDFINSNI
mgnify:CR=1 FL=1